MSRTHQRWVFILFLVFAAVLAACQPSATPTPTPRPTETTAPSIETTAAVEAATAETTAAVALPTEEATVETALVPTEAASEEATEAVALPSEEATEALALIPTEEASAEATLETTAEATVEVGTIIEVAQQAGDFSTLLTALDTAGLTDTLKGEGPYTVFAPTDAAFQALLDSTGMTASELLNRADLADILKYHVVDAKVTADDLETYRSTDNPDQIVVPTLNGENLTITFADDGTIMINGTAKVTLKNVEASNGVIHVIDAVLMPPSMEATEEATTEVAMLPSDAVATAEMVSTEEMSTPEATMAPVASATVESPVTTVASGSTVTIAPDGNVVVALAAGLSGEGIAPLGIDIQRGAELALADRPTVTVGGKTFTVQLDVQDDQCSADGGQAVANRFSSEAGVVGVVGPMCSSACRAAAPIFDAADYTSISPSCTAPDLTTSSYASFNRSVVSDAFQGAIAAQYIYDVLGVRKIATLHDGSPYGEGLVAVVTQSFEALGGEVVSSDAVQVGDTDFRGLLDDIAQKEPELIYFGGFAAEAARLITQRADAGLEDVPFMGADGIQGTEVVNLSGEASSGVYATAAIAASSQALNDFLARYQETYGEEPPAPYHATAYDAVNLILDAVEAVGTVDADGNLVVDRGALSNYIRTFKDYQGLTGVLNADGTGETSVSDIGIFQVQNGAFEQIYTGALVDGKVALTEYTAPAAESTPEATEVMAEATEVAPETEATAESTEVAPTGEATAEATAAS